MNVDTFARTMVKIGIFTSIAFWSAVITHFLPTQNIWLWDFMEWFDFPGSLLGIGGTFGYCFAYEQMKESSSVATP